MLLDITRELMDAPVYPGDPAPQLEAELKTSLSGITELELDFSGLEYISSAGLRVLLAAQKTMSRQGKMTIRNVNETIMEVFEITGFVEILTIV